MTFYFCFLPHEDVKKNPVNCGYRYVTEHKSDWVEAPDIAHGENYLAAGWNKGGDFIVYQDTVYEIYKSFIIVEDDAIIHLCRESIQGCDLLE